MKVVEFEPGCLMLQSGVLPMKHYALYSTILQYTVSVYIITFLNGPKEINVIFNAVVSVVVNVIKVVDIAALL